MRLEQEFQILLYTVLYGSILSMILYYEDILIKRHAKGAALLLRKVSLALSIALSVIWVLCVSQIIENPVFLIISTALLAVSCNMYVHLAKHKSIKHRD